MTWTRLDNPKPSAGALGRDSVRVLAAAAARNSRYVKIKLGGGIAQRASFTKTEHKCHLLLGSGEDHGNVGIAVDDSLGKFVAKRRADGHYQITITAAAAADRFNLTFPPFERTGVLVGGGNGPSFITFAADREFLAAGGGK